jgi:hypothetical protein
MVYHHRRSVTPTIVTVSGRNSKGDESVETPPANATVP